MNLYKIVRINGVWLFSNEQHDNGSYIEYGEVVFLLKNSEKNSECFEVLTKNGSIGEMYSDDSYIRQL